MEYVLDQYDTEKRISFEALKDQYHLKQWMQFQTTAQGPIIQHIFRWTFTESNPDARAGYIKDLRRILKVLDDELADKEWLVGNKCSAADLSFVPFHSRLSFYMGADAPNTEVELPHLDAWYKRMTERSTVQKILKEHRAVLKDLGVLPKE